MARLTDSRGVHSVGPCASRRAFCAAVPRAATPRCRPDETVPGLECCYGTYAYSYADLPPDVPRLCQQARRHGCHNPIETPDERHHCDACGGDYCVVHADPEDHDCASVIRT